MSTLDVEAGGLLITGYQLPTSHLGVPLASKPAYNLRCEAQGHIPFWIESGTALPVAVDRELSSRGNELRSFRGASESLRLRLTLLTI
jgi:hypothetical protein